jgi:HPt (histidine-containing phosphotransfer) domain-containing protein
MKNGIEKADAEARNPTGLYAEIGKQDRKSIDWDAEELLARVEGDRPLMLELLEMFHEESRSTMERAHTAFSAGDLNELSRVAHGMKGMMKNLAMGAGAEIAGVLEKAAANGSQTDSAIQLAKLEEALALTLREVKAQMTVLRA